MEHNYAESQLRGIAEECGKFEHVITAMGYGYSLLNVSPDEFVRRCNDCIHLSDGACGIFQKEIRQWE